MRILAQTTVLRDAVRKRRGLIAIGFAALLAAVAATGTVKDSSPPPARATIVAPLAVALPERGSEGVHVYWNETRFDRGDTFAALLGRLGVDAADAAKLLKENGGSKPLRSLRPGMTVQAQTSDLGELLALRFVAGDEAKVLGFERDGDRFGVIDQVAEITRQTFVTSGEIRSSLFVAADDAELPDAITMQIADIFSGDIDFHRDLRRGDRFAVVYEAFFYNGRAVRSGRVLAAEFINDKKVVRAIWFADEDGMRGYYAPDGRNLRTAFLRSPLEFSRVTSGFETRFHPILQDWRAHKGVDYSAPAGTRIKATADGTVEVAEEQNGYGNVIVLRHHSGITTLYAHLSGFASGVRKGAHVVQGDVIGYVGATGWATGPHLHYEFRVNNENRDPLAMAIPVAEPVAAHRLAAFRAAADRLAAQLDLAARTNLAASE
ncbi:MAG TPA: peptidoglycan DD-metalloendopeptidase family protein [Burkholderiales bacterium]|nr:peptidoglycan DD-metalloendopeptidase family protein [Burkholderiales bacterium]